jgi:hydrogenase expression/formation protein HypE
MRSVSIGHGAGGKLTSQIIGLAQKAFSSKRLDISLDSAIRPTEGGRIAFTTDSYVVSPLFFPGGDIGRIAVCGTVNDLAVVGARPRYLSCSLIIEEGLPFETLERVLASMAAAAREAGVEIVTGDSKVVEKGHGDGLYVNTAGLGFIPEGLDLSGSAIEEGDALLVSGTLGDHAMTIMNARSELGFESDLKSDAAPLNGLVAALLESGSRVRFMRDITRGGLAELLHELSELSEVSLEIDEDSLPLRSEVRTLSSMLGIDVLSMANEGKLLAVVASEDAERALSVMRSHPYGLDAAVVGRVVSDRKNAAFANESKPRTVFAGGEPRVRLRSSTGGFRIIGRPSGLKLPRIC